MSGDEGIVRENLTLKVDCPVFVRKLHGPFGSIGNTEEGFFSNNEIALDYRRIGKLLLIDNQHALRSDCHLI